MFQKIIGRNTKSQRKRKVKVENTRKGKKSRGRKQKGKKNNEISKSLNSRKVKNESRCRNKQIRLIRFGVL